jgi:hypothetical protein
VPVFSRQCQKDVEHGRRKREERAEIFFHHRIPLYRIPTVKSRVKKEPAQVAVTVNQAGLPCEDERFGLSFQTDATRLSQKFNEISVRLNLYKGLRENEGN